MSRSFSPPTVALGSLEIIVNRLLANDARALARCRELSGATLAVRLTDSAIALRLSAVDHGLQVQRWRDGDPFDVGLAGPVSAFVRVAGAGEGAAIAGSGLRIEGDIGVAQGFGAIFTAIDFDPADWVDRRLGPLPASVVERGIGAARRLGRRLAREVPGQLGDYLIEETGDIVRGADGARFDRDVVTLRDDVERLSARIDRLGQRV